MLILASGITRVRSTVTARAEVTVDRPQAVVFAALADPAHPAGRSGEVIAAEVSEPIGAGSEFRLQFRHESGRLGWLDGRVSEYSPPEVVAYDVRGGRGILRTRTTYVVEPAGAGAHVRGVFELSPPWVIRKRVQRAFQAHVEGTLNRLAEDLG
ncbi:MAG TPA: SRPBCC family protein [Candidatus Dormibacteraeota bacterium]